MTKAKDILEFTFQDSSDEEVNEMAEWLESLTFDQLKFIKVSYDGYLNSQSQFEHGSDYLH